MEGYACSPFGSIPACAGEPLLLGSVSAKGQVYPRVCGGTYPCLVHPLCGLGLSPRVRGNRCFEGAGCGPLRSIPACAGEPLLQTSPSIEVKVYPRVCGGTICMRRRLRGCQGLSPRVRGNPVSSMSWPIVVGSIPACAGEPGYVSSMLFSAWVYPRVCGGTL